MPKPKASAKYPVLCKCPDCKMIFTIKAVRPETVVKYWPKCCPDCKRNLTDEGADYIKPGPTRRRAAI